MTKGQCHHEIVHILYNPVSNIIFASIYLSIYHL